MPPGTGWSTARYSSELMIAPLPLAGVPVTLRLPATVVFGVVRTMTGAYATAPGNMEPELKVIWRVLFQVPSAFASIANAPAWNSPVALSVSVQAATVAVTPSPNTRPPASRARICFQRRALRCGSALCPPCRDCMLLRSITRPRWQ